MSSQKLSIQVFSTMNAVASSNAQVEIRDLNSGERGFSAAKNFGIWFLAAIPCVFIPGLHFFLVPGFLLVGVFMAKQQLGMHKMWISGEITCPECKTIIAPDLKPFAEPKHLKCPGCGKDLVFK